MGTEVITDKDRLLRRIIIDPSYIKPDNKITSLAFKPRKTDYDGLSVDLERLTTYQAAIKDKTKFRLARLEASIPLSLGLECIHKPLLDNRAHSLIRGNFTNSICRKLANFAQVIYSV